MKRSMREWGESGGLEVGSIVVWGKVRVKSDGKEEGRGREKILRCGFGDPHRGRGDKFRLNWEVISPASSAYYTFPYLIFISPLTPRHFPSLSQPAQTQGVAAAPRHSFMRLFCLFLLDNKLFHSSFITSRDHIRIMAHR